MDVIIGAISSLAIVGVALYFLKKPIAAYLATLSQKTIEESLKVAEQKSKEIFKEERERVVEQVTGQMKLNEQSLESKKDLILEAVNNIRREINQNQDKLIQNDQQRITEFTNLKTIISEHKTITQNLQVTTDNLRKMLSNNQLRGSFGQEVAEDLLKMAGFVKDVNYLSQTKQLTTSNIPDFTILLPDGAKINVDVKFPFQALQRLQETEDKGQQEQFLKEFRTDIKNKIKEVTTRNYINPEERTVDFVVMFIPNEMIFSFIYERFPEVCKEAISQKVIMCGPFSFTGILRMIQQSYDNFKYQKNLQQIIGLVRLFETEYIKFSESFDALGKHILKTSEQFQIVSTTRDKQLTRVIEKIKSEEPSLLPQTTVTVLEKPVVEVLSE